MPVIISNIVDYSKNEVLCLCYYNNGFIGLHNFPISYLSDLEVNCDIEFDSIYYSQITSVQKRTDLSLPSIMKMNKAIKQYCKINNLQYIDESWRQNLNLPGKGVMSLEDAKMLHNCGLPINLYRKDVKAFWFLDSKLFKLKSNLNNNFALIYNFTNKQIELLNIENNELDIYNSIDNFHKKYVKNEIKEISILESKEIMFARISREDLFNLPWYMNVFKTYVTPEQVIDLFDTKTKLEKEIAMSQNQSKKPTMTELFVEDTKDAAYEVAAKQAAHGTSKAMQKLVEKLPDSSMIKKLASSKIGEATVSTVVGLAIPQVTSNKKLQRLAGSMRKNGLSTLMSKGLSAATSKLMPKIQETLQSLPSLHSHPTKMRFEDVIKPSSTPEAEKEHKAELEAERERLNQKVKKIMKVNK